MKYRLFVFVLAIACVLGIGCEQGENVEKPKVSNESAVELAAEVEAGAVILESTFLSAVKMAESMLKTDPKNQKLLELTAKGYCGYSFAFLEDENTARASAMYKKGMSYSVQLLEIRDIISEGKFNGEKLKTKDTPALFWHSFCMAGFIKLIQVMVYLQVIMI